jgi:thiamine biosynthesis lipoprotein
MGTEVTISLITPTGEIADTIAVLAFSIIHEYEARFSRFLETSELMQLNNTKNMCVSKEFFTVLTQSYELYRATGGAFNPLVQIAKQGYTADYALIKDTEQESSASIYNIDFSTVIMDQKTRRVILQDTHALDFGGFLKGYLANHISKLIEEKYSACVGNIVNIGGDLHTQGYDEHGNPFVFGVYNPVLKTEFMVPITNKSLATSGTYARSWRLNDGSTRHHILSPSNMTNTETHYVSVSIIHDDGGTAEAYTKLFLVGDPYVLEVSRPHDTYRYFLITQSGDVIHSKV